MTIYCDTCKVYGHASEWHSFAYRRWYVRTYGTKAERKAMQEEWDNLASEAAARIARRGPRSHQDQRSPANPSPDTP